MDNVVQQININDIIPGNYQPSKEEQRKIDDLALMIRSVGLLDPILVRPKNGKYEIILGHEKYEAARIAKQKEVPVLIKNISDTVFKQYKNIDCHTDTDNIINSSENDTLENNDIISLSSLNKEIIEYERDDFKMNNNMQNNNYGVQQTNLNETEPTFGGKFFPSLEDEPTNMNMMGGLNMPPSNTMSAPSSNLIDLTDLTNENNSPSFVPNLSNPTMNEQPVGNNLNNIPENNIMIPNGSPIEIPTNSDILNISNLQNNNVQPQPTQEQVLPESINENLDNNLVNQMPNNISQELNNDFTIPQNIGQSNFDLNQSLVSNPQIIGTEPVTSVVEPVTSIPDVAPSNEYFNQQPTLQTNIEPNSNLDVNSNIPKPEPILDIQESNFKLGQEPVIEQQNTINNNSQKDISPILNILKTVTYNLEKLGYKINTVEENLPSSTKLTIEIEK